MFMNKTPFLFPKPIYKYKFEDSFLDYILYDDQYNTHKRLKWTLFNKD